MPPQDTNPAMLPSPTQPTDSPATPKLHSAPTVPNWGEALPLFCETCGYSFVGLRQTCCGQCQLRYFACPECGYHQPINNLRPAAQRLLGRLRAIVLTVWVCAKLSVLAIALLIWFAVGYDSFYSRQIGPPNAMGFKPTLAPMALSLKLLVNSSLYMAGYAAVMRLLLLRWTASWMVGLALSGMAIASIFGGGLSRSYTLQSPRLTQEVGFWSGDLIFWLLILTAVAQIAAHLAWPAWRLILWLTLPASTAQMLANWATDTAVSETFARQPSNVDVSHQSP